MDTELLNLIVVNIPNFLGLFVAVFVLFRIILVLLDAIRESNTRWYELVTKLINDPGLLDQLRTQVAQETRSRDISPLPHRPKDNENA